MWHEHKIQLQKWLPIKSKPYNNKTVNKMLFYLFIFLEREKH